MTDLLFSFLQTLIFNLRHGEGEVERLSEDGSDISQQSGETRISLNVQQINSRYHTVQSTAKVRIKKLKLNKNKIKLQVTLFLFQDIVKKCENAVQAHKTFEAQYQTSLQWLAQFEEKFKKNSNVQGNREEICEKIQAIEEMMSLKQDAMTNLNKTTESGEKLFGSTAPEGREGIRLQLQDLQTSIESIFDQLTKLERDLQTKLVRWSGYEESSSTFIRWLQEVEEQLKGKLVLKTTLDEKKAQLQNYRALLQDIRSQKPVLDDLKEKAK